MVSRRLKNIFAVSVFLFVAHGIEEYLTGFYDVDPILKFVLSVLDSMSISHSIFLLLQIMFWLFLISLLLITHGNWHLRLMVIPGLIYIFELQHIWEAVRTGGYYLGLITALAFPIIAIFYWKELIENLKLENSLKIGN